LKEVFLFYVVSVLVKIKEQKKGSQYVSTPCKKSDVSKVVKSSLCHFALYVSYVKSQLSISLVCACDLSKMFNEVEKLNNYIPYKFWFAGRVNVKGKTNASCIMWWVTGKKIGVVEIW